MKDVSFETPTFVCNVTSAAQILGLCRTGVAATDSTLNIDLQKDGYRSVLEVIGSLASDIMENTGEGLSESDTSGENDAAITHSISAVDPHPEWLNRWKAALSVWRQTEEDTPEANAAWAESEQLSVLLCQTPVQTAQGLAAQFEWFKGDLGEYITQSVGTTHSCILDVMQDGTPLTVSLEHSHRLETRGQSGILWKKLR
jgi:hypothetical protein